MVRPVVHDTTERLYDAVGEAFTRPDADEGTGHQWHLLLYLDAVGALLGVVDDLVRDTDDGPGWSGVFDIDRTPLAQLPYLGQFAGVQLPGGLAEAVARGRILNAENQRRGTPEAIRDAVALLLTGSKTVRITERDTSPYHFRVRTYLDETPDEPAVLGEIQRQKPAGLQFTYEVAVGGSYDELGGDYATYDAVSGDFATYNDLDDYQP